MTWPEHKLSLLVDRFISGGTPSTKVQEYWDGDIPWITGADFLDGEVVLGRRYINRGAIDNSATNIVPKGSILMVTRTGVGKIAIAPVDIAISQDITGIVLQKGLAVPYAIAAIRNRMNVVLAAQRGATIKGVTRKDVENISIPLPAPSEQQRIVEILDQADALRKKRAEADEKAARILTALFYKMFGDPATNSMGWKMVLLGKLSVGPPQYGANAKAINYQEGCPRYVRITDITDDGLLSANDIKTIDMENWGKYRLEEGDLLFARSGATVGKTYLYQPDDGLCVFAGYLIRFQLNREQLNPWVAFALTQTPYYKSWVASKRRAAAQPNINGQEYAELFVPKPAQDIQIAFVEAAQQVRKLYEQRKNVASKLNNLFASLLYRAFSGNLTANWREGHMKELMSEMEVQAKALNLETVQ